METKEEGFNLDFGKYNGERKFQNNEEFEQFLNNEANAYKWLKDIDQGYYYNIINSFKNSINYINNKPYFKDSFNRVYGENPLPLSGTSVFNAIEQLRNENPKIAMGALHFCRNKDFSANNADHFVGALSMSIASLQIIKTPRAIRSELKKLSQQYNDKLADEDKYQKDIHNGYDTLKAKSKKDFLLAYRKFRTREKNTIKNINKNNDDLLKNLLDRVEEAIDDINHTQKTYSEFMRLKAPVEYWEKKQKKHIKFSQIWGSIFLFFCSAGSFSLYKLLHMVVNQLIEVATTEKPLAVYVIYTTIAISMTTIFFWFGRILSRLYLSEHHLAIDAGERAVMVQTYLALINDGEITESDRSIILGALFRPTEDGIVRDDGVPDASHMAILSKFMTNNKAG